MRVVAIERGHDGRELREIGEEFDVADDLFEVVKKDNVERICVKDGSTWFVPVDEKPAPKPAVRNARPPGQGPARGSDLKVE